MAEFVSSLRFRLMLLVLLAVVPAFGVILYSAARHRDLTGNEVQRNALGAARVIAAEHERLLENAHQLLITLARVPQVREKSGAACSKILAGLLEPLYADLGVTDLKGNVVCSASPTSSPAKRGGSYLNRVIETHDFSVGDFRIVPATGKTLANLGYPVLESPRLLRAVVYAVLDLTWITRITAKTHLYPGASVALVDSDGMVLLRYPEGEGWLGKPIFAATHMQGSIFREAEGMVESVGADGVKRLFAFSKLKKKIGGQTVYAAIDIPTALAFADATRILVQNLVLLGVLSALTLVAAWFGADLFVLRRINDLVTATKQLASGNLRARTQLPYGKSELGHMARTFDDLAETLEKRQAEAKTSAEQIERQRQRQAALHDINLAITSTLDLASVLRTLLAEIAALFPSCAATVSWINKETGLLEVIAHRPLGDGRGSQSGVETEQGLPMVVLTTRRPLAVANAQLDPRTTNPEFLRRHQLASYLGLPMIANGQVLGVLSFYLTDEQGFSGEETHFLTSLSNQAAMAIDNSRLYEQTRKQATELEKSNKIKDEFLGVMSHELRTPLNIIMNYAEGLRTGMFGEMNRDQEKGADKIESQARHLLYLINEILEITKIETGTVIVQREPLDLNSFIAELRSDYMMPLERDLILKWEHPLDLPMVDSDPIKMKQILNNLINNAIKFTERGSITVSVRLLDREKMLELNVTDTGPGIPSEMLPVIFEKFRQIDSTTTRSHSGAGLGLYIVKTFVELLHGKVSVQSKVGEGSTFTVRLPVRYLNQPAPAAERPGVEAVQGSSG
jgi:signal transduction histidine kinase/HAMP domain-containing protein